MLIGLDFDNTIVSYDEIFHTVAVERGLVSLDFPVDKIAVRDFLRHADNEQAWIEMQGYVYGERMVEALPYPGVLEFIRQMQCVGHTIVIVSHKTKHPFLGPHYDLHVAAHSWVTHHLRKDTEFFLPTEQIFFELTKAEKLMRITQLACDLFIDDLPEILLSPDFPDRTTRVLFDPKKRYTKEECSTVHLLDSWDMKSAAHLIKRIAEVCNG